MKFPNIFTLIIIVLLISVTGFSRAGDLDISFDEDGKVTNLFNEPNAVSVFDTANATQPDGKIVFAGVEIAPGTSSDAIRVFRYNTNGSLDTSFGNNGTIIFSVGFFERVEDMAIQPDGKILISGNRFFGTSDDFFVVRLNPNGTLDNTFDDNGVVAANITGNSDEFGGNMVLQPDGKIVLVGRTDLDRDPANDNWAIIRFNTNGSLDTSFAGNGIFTIEFGNTSSALNSVALQSDGKIVVGGNFFNGENNDFISARLNPNSGLDLTYGTNGVFITQIGNSNDSINILRVQPDDKIIAAGFSQNSTGDIVVARFTKDGAFDTNFGTNGFTTASITPTSNEAASDMELQADGKIVILTDLGNQAVLMRFNKNGSLDNGFGLNGIASAQIRNNTSAISSALSIQDDGKIVASGIAFVQSSSVDYYFTARFLAFSENQNPPFDFDGDGKTDVSIFRPDPGQWWYLRSSDNDSRAFQFGQSSDEIVPADFTGDGKTDIAFWRESTGEWFVLRSEDNSFYSFPFGTTGDIPIPADFDGDGKADPAIYRPSNSTWFVLNSGGGTTIQQFGLNGDAPIPNDFDGDGKDDLAVFRPSESQWFYQRSTDFVVKGFQFGSTGDKAIPADFTGDSKADIAFWRPSSGEWFILRSEDNSFFAFPFGTNGDKPIPGDYDGDGQADAAVFRPSNNIWFLQQSTNGFTAVQFGVANDIPIPSAFIP